MNYTIAIWTLALAACLATSGCGRKALRTQIDGATASSDLPGLGADATATDTTRMNNPVVETPTASAPYNGLSSNFASENFSKLGGVQGFGHPSATNAVASTVAAGLLLTSEGTSLPGAGEIYKAYAGRFHALNAAGQAISGNTVYAGASIDFDARVGSVAGILAANDANVGFTSAGGELNRLTCDLIRRANNSVSLLIRYNRTTSGNPLWYTSEFPGVASGTNPVQIECLRQNHTLVAYVNGNVVAALSHPFPQVSYTGTRTRFDVGYATKALGFTNIGRNTIRSAAFTVFPSGAIPNVFLDRFSVASVGASYLRTGATLSVVAANTVASLNGGYGQLVLPQFDVDNVDVSAMVKFTADGGSRVAARLDRGGADSGYYASITLSQNVATLQLQKVSNGAISNLGSIPVAGVGIGFQGRLRILAVDSQITAQLLTPAGVVLQSRSVSDSAYQFGRVGVGTGGGAGLNDFLVRLP